MRRLLAVLPIKNAKGSHNRQMLQTERKNTEREKERERQREWSKELDEEITRK